MVKLGAAWSLIAKGGVPELLTRAWILDSSQTPSHEIIRKIDYLSAKCILYMNPVILHWVVAVNCLSKASSNIDEVV